MERYINVMVKNYLPPLGLLQCSYMDVFQIKGDKKPTFAKTDSHVLRVLIETAILN